MKLFYDIVDRFRSRCAEGWRTEKVSSAYREQMYRASVLAVVV